MINRVMMTSLDFESIQQIQIWNANMRCSNRINNQKKTIIYMYNALSMSINTKCIKK